MRALGLQNCVGEGEVSLALALQLFGAPFPQLNDRDTESGEYR